MRRRFTQLFSLLLLLLVAASPAIAQTTTATIRGTVEDESGNAFPGSTVRATNVASGYTTTAVGNAFPLSSRILPRRVAVVVCAMAGDAATSNNKSRVNN